MRQLRVGFRKWVDSRPIDEHIAAIGAGEIEPIRANLGDTDEDLWPVDDRGDPADPWARVVEVPMSQLDGSAEYLFTTGSRGGEKAIRRLSRQYGIEQAKRGDALPVIDLAMTGYKHKLYGQVDEPKFPIVDWIANDPGAVTATNNEEAAAIGDDLNDDIPW